MNDRAPSDRPYDNPAPLSIVGLILSRGGLPLLDNFDLALLPGEAIFLTGRNGAGKTTLLRAIGGFIRPESGQIELGGNNVSKSAREQIGWLGHADGLKDSETVRESLRFWCEFYSQDRSAIMSILRRLDMHRVIDQPSGRLSRGQKRRIGLARVALSERPIWLLDEPAGPLDAAGRDRLAELVARHRQRGGSVIAATHQVLDWPGARTIDISPVASGGAVS